MGASSGFFALGFPSSWICKEEGFYFTIYIMNGTLLSYKLLSNIKHSSGRSIPVLSATVKSTLYRSQSNTTTTTCSPKRDALWNVRETLSIQKESQVGSNTHPKGSSCWWIWTTTFLLVGVSIMTESLTPPCIIWDKVGSFLSVNDVKQV